MKQRNTKRRFVICVQNESSEDLEIGKVYQVLPDKSADRENYIRVIDESGEDYLYPSGYFVPITLPQEAERALLALSPPVAAA